MGTTTVTTYTCDKDAATATGTGLPAGWIMVRVTGLPPPNDIGPDGEPLPPPHEYGTALLCPGCASPVTALMTSLLPPRQQEPQQEPAQA